MKILMRQFLSNVWEDVEEIITHVVTSTIIIISICMELWLINYVISIFFSEEDYLIYLMEMASKGTILALFIVYNFNILRRAIKKNK